MSIASIHPTVYNFKKNEVETLAFLATRKLIKNYTDLDAQIGFAYYDYKDLPKLRTKDLILHFDFDMEIEKKSRKVIIGANVTGDYAMATYFLAICDASKNMNAIRKFHFDYASPTVKTKQPVPTFHLQYGGQPTPKMGKLNISSKKLDSWLSVPRLNFHPINLAILIDMVFCEFKTQDSIKLTENGDWRAHVKKNEEFIVRPYFKCIADFCASGQYSNKRLIRDYCYGK